MAGGTPPRAPQLVRQNACSNFNLTELGNTSMGTPMRGEVERLIQEWGLDEYGSHYGQVRVAAEAKPSAKPYLSNRDRQMLALPTHKRSKVNEVLWAIEDLIGPCKSWPKWVAKICWMKKLSDVNSLRLITFCIGNGLPPHLLFQWLRVRKVKHNLQKFHNTMGNVKASMGSEGPTRHFYWNLHMEEYCFMNGLPRNNLTMTVKDPSTPAPP